MAPDTQLKDPWLVAVWPGMGHVAISAAYFMMSKLDMELLTEFPASDLFDVEYVEVKRGLIQPVRRPRSRLFVWRDPEQRQDIVIFTGEAQPEIHKYSLCQKIISFAQTLGVQRVFTFAAMATRMRPEYESRVFAAVTDAAALEELRDLDIELLEAGQISGLNGVLMGAAAEVGLPGVCLLGEMPHIFMQFPFPKASLAVLERFTAIAGIELEMTELYEHARAVDEQLGEILERVQHEMEQPEAADVEEEYSPEPAEAPRLNNEQQQQIEELFDQAESDRSKAYELKQLLDKLDVFKEYEDRFLDLFKPPA